MNNKTDTITMTLNEMREIVSHLIDYSPSQNAANVRNRLIEVAKTHTPNNELYILGQSAIMEAAALKRELMAEKERTEALRKKLEILLAFNRNDSHLSDWEDVKKKALLMIG